MLGLPVEIWKNIFDIAASVPLKDKFASNGMAYLGVFVGKPIVSSSYSGGELLRMLCMRSTIVKVCRSWYHIGIQALYAHIILSGGVKFPKDLTNLYRTLIGSPDLARHTCRLEMSIGVIAHRSCSWDNMLSIVDLLPNLSILTGPPGMFLFLDDASDSVNLGRGNLQSDHWNTISIFSVVFSGLESIPRFDHVVLPALQTLIIAYP